MEQFVLILVLLSFLVHRAQGGCSLYCAKNAHPVCGHSPTHGYKTFPDKCALEQTNHCAAGDWTLIHSGDCTSTEISGCSADCGPVCGRSPTQGYRNFANKCYLDVEAQISDYTFAHDGACTSTEVPPSVCPGACTQDYTPVCGYSPVSGYRTFPNSCYLTLENTCFYGSYSLSHTGECTTKEFDYNCRRTCTKDLRPVCGLSLEQGFKTFGNLCTLFYENGCPHYDSDFKLIHAGECTTNEKASLCQPGFCSATGSPVCASTLPFYRTFRNKCLFYVENSCKFGDFDLVHTGECTQKENQESCSVACSQQAVPVCGFSSTRGYKTFTNRCFINYDNACYGSDYGAVHLGECKQEELDLICGGEFCQKNPAKTVCGVSPTKGYTSFDNECLLYAENTCKYGDYKLAHVGECTKQERDVICVSDFCLKSSTPVCGYSQATGYYTFTNQCFLNAENICKHKAYTLKHEGKCTSHEVGSQCPMTCHSEHQLLCAHSPTLGYKTFHSRCAIQEENSCNGGDYQVRHEGECTKTELEYNCQRQCTYDYKPICALSPTKGFHTFPNKCSYILDITCYGSDYKFEHGGVCRSSGGTTPTPQCHNAESLCPSGYSPVCAYSKSNRAFKTFSTKCILDADNKCKYDYDFIFAHFGACSQDEIGNNCRRSCTAEILPVCGFSPTLGYKNFKSSCELLLFHSCRKSDYTLAHEGKCHSNEVPTCSTGCTTNVSPVCGFSPSNKVFKTFINKCKWEYENQCDYGDYVMAHTGACTQHELENNCNRACTPSSSRVCGYSTTKGYKIFQNLCSFIFDITCRGGDYLYSNEGKCKYPEGPQRDCPANCPKDESPICTHSSNTKCAKTFLNQCLWAAENRCNYGDYVFVHQGKCTKDETGKKCYRKCPLDYRPVCGLNVHKGYRTFPSLCELEVANKCDGADYSLAHVGKCTHKELDGSCNHNCPLYYVGVCGYSHVKGFKTFANECFLDRENSCTLSDYQVSHPGKCTPEETGKKCNRVCQLVYSPICAKSASKGYKNFANFCLLDRENSCFYLDFNVEHQGECFPWELCVNCN